MGHFPDGADSTWSATQGAKQWHGQNGYMFEDTAQGRGIQGCVVNCYGWVPDGKAIDVRADALVSITPQGDCGWFETFQYDAAGRQSQASATDNVGQYCIPHTDHSLARGFDAENHTVVQTSTAWPYWPWGIGGATTVSLGYQWGPNGHPAMAGSSTTAPVSNWETLHWDGDTLLFSSNQSGQVDDIKVGMLADYTPLDANYRGLTVWDRELSGLWVGEHNTSGAGSGGDPDAYRRGTQCMAPGATSSGGYLGTTGFVGPKGFTGLNVGQGGYMCSPAQDGYSDGYNVFQGVRAYDPQLQTWTTPDAYAGDVHDPASQKPYMYNRNNPLIYSDPSGFCVENQDACMGGVDWDEVSRFSNAMGNVTFLIATSLFPESDALLPARGVGMVRAAAIGAQAYREASAAAKLSVIVIGQRGTYLEAATKIGGKALNIAPKVWGALDDVAEKWAANKAFLDEAIKAGDSIKLSSNPIYSTGLYAKELDYLMEQGYTLSSDLKSLIPPPK